MGLVTKDTIASELKALAADSGSLASDRDRIAYAVKVTNGARICGIEAAESVLVIIPKGTSPAEPHQPC